VLRAGGTQAEAAKAAGDRSVSTIKRWLDEPEFRAMIASSPDVRSGAPPKLGKRRGVLASQRDTRLRMWVAADSQEVLGSYIPPASFDNAGAVLHVHVVRSADVDTVRASIAEGEYPADSPYVPVPLAGCDDLLENLPLVCRLGSQDAGESLAAWLEVWTFTDEGGSRSDARGGALGRPAAFPRGADQRPPCRLDQVEEGRPNDTCLRTCGLDGADPRRQRCGAFAVLPRGRRAGAVAGVEAWLGRVASFSAFAGRASDLDGACLCSR
jgi:hypothetical protein